MPSLHMIFKSEYSAESNNLDDIRIGFGSAIGKSVLDVVIHPGLNILLEEAHIEGRSELLECVNQVAVNLRGEMRLLYLVWVHYFGRTKY